MGNNCPQIWWFYLQFSQDQNFGEVKMGSEVTARCGCGVEARILIGGGMQNFATTCYFPCLCEHCHSIVQVNLLAKTHRCPKCRSSKTIPYDDGRLRKSPGRHVMAEWNLPELGRELKLTDGKYRCPKCDKMTLRFSETALWD